MPKLRSLAHLFGDKLSFPPNACRLKFLIIVADSMPRRCSMGWFSFFLGLMAGTLAGIILMCLLAMSGESPGLQKIRYESPSPAIKDG
jgi:hypothetical protein